MKSHGQSMLTVFEQVLEARICIGCHAESAELPHRPMLPAVHGWINSAGVWRLTGIREVFVVIKPPNVFGRIHAFQRNARDRSERLIYVITDVFGHRSS